MSGGASGELRRLAGVQTRASEECAVLFDN
jgi:hypothetical protein